jgi:hypothetical protein
LSTLLNIGGDIYVFKKNKISFDKSHLWPNKWWKCPTIYSFDCEVWLPIVKHTKAKENTKAKYLAWGNFETHYILNTKTPCPNARFKNPNHTF